MTQQIPASENQNSEVDMKTAMEDIALIKHIINHTEINLRRLGWLFLVYGSATLAFLIVTNLLSVYVSRTSTLQNAANLSIILSVLSYAVTAVLLILFLRKRKSIRKTENVYTMKLFDLWGVTLFAPVFLKLILVIVLIVPSWNSALGNTIFSYMQFGAVCTCVFFTGQYISCRPMKIIAAVLFVLFPVLFLIPVPVFSNVNFEKSMQAAQVFSYCNAKTNLVSLLLPFVYIGMGIFSLKKQRGSIYGDE